MATFLVGMYDGTIDGKNRLSVPFAFRRKLEGADHPFYVLPGPRRGTLALYPEVQFERSRPAAPEARLSEETRAWRTFEHSQCALLNSDEQGRVLFPERLLKRVGLGKEVTLVGVQDHIELWNRADFQKFEDEQWARYDENRAKAMAELREFAPVPSAVESLPKP